MRLYEFISFGLLVIALSGLGIDCFPTSELPENQNSIHEGTESEGVSVSPDTPTDFQSAGNENIPENIPALLLEKGTEITAKNDFVSISAISYQIMAFIPGAEGDVSSEDDGDANEDVESDRLVPSRRDFMPHQSKLSMTSIMNVKLVQIEVGDLTESSAEDQH